MNTTDLEHYHLRRSQIGRKRDEGEALYEIFGLRLPEFNIVVAAMAHFRAFQVPPQRQDIEMLGIDPATARLAIRARYLEETPLRALRPTAKAWKEMGEWSVMRDDERERLEAQISAAAAE